MGIIISYGIITFKGKNLTSQVGQNQTKVVIYPLRHGLSFSIYGFHETAS